MIKKNKSNETRKVTRRRKQRKQRSIAQKIIFAGKIMLVAAIVAFVTLIYINLDAISRDFYQFTANIGFTTKNIIIEGQKYTSNDQIAKTLKIRPGMPILAISLSDLKDRLEKLDWIKQAIIERRLPGNIHIYIIERTPIALGQKDHKLYIIDDEGEIINEKELAAHISLPIIIGDGAEIYANSLITTLKADPELFKHITSIIRISEHRWNVRLDNDLEVKLPSKDLDKAWKKIIKMYKKKDLFSPRNAVIDLRIPNKIFIEKK